MEEGPAADPDKYPGPRAASAAQRVHYYCGKWPHELLGSVEPLTWVERLSDEFATLVRLTVKSQKFELGDVIKRLKDVVREHPYDGAKYVNRQDIAVVRDWLRKEGIDALHYRRRSRNSPGEGYDEGDESIVIKSGSEDPVIIAETPFDSDDSDYGLGDFENGFDMGETEHGEESSSEHNQASNNQTHSNAATPVRQNTQPVARSIPPEPSSTRVGNHHTPATQPLSQPATTPSNSRGRSPSDRFRANEVINANFQDTLRRRTMASSVSRSGPSSQPHSTSRGDRTHPNPSTPVERLNNAARGAPLAAPSPATPSRRANRSPNRRAAPESHVRTETRQQTASDRGEVRRSTNAEPRPINTESRHGPSTPRPDAQASGNAIPTPTSTPDTPAPPTNGPPSLMRLIESRSTTTTRPRQVIKVEDDSPPPTTLASYLDGLSGGHTNTSTQAHETTTPSASRNIGTINSSTPARPAAQPNVDPASSSLTRATNHPHSDTMPPTRHAHAIPLSALVNRDVPRKRPLESDRPIAHNTPQQPATSSPLRIVHGTTTAPIEAPLSQATPTNNSAPGPMASTHATPTSRAIMEPNPHLQPTLPRPNSFFATGPPAWANGESSSRPTHTQVAQSSIAIPAQTTSSGNVENRPSKRLRSDDPRQQFTFSEPFDFDATLPDGESFKRQLQGWRVWAEPHITQIDTKLENIQNEIRALHQIMFTNNSNREGTTKHMQSMQQSMQDNEAHITKTYKIIEVLEPESIGDESTREYLEKRKRQLAERERAQQSYQEDFAHAQNLLREIEIQQPMIEKKLDDYVQEETTITKSKESLQSALKKCNLQIDLIDGQGGWTKAFERFGTNGRAGRLDPFSAFNGEVRR